MRNKFKVFVTYSYKSIRFIWSVSKEYSLLNILNIILSSLQAFPEMFLLKYSVDFLTKKAELAVFIIIIGTIILLMAILGILSTLVSNRLEYVKKAFNTKVLLEIDERCLKTEYINLQSKSYLENKEFAISSVNNGSLDLFIQSLNKLISSTIIMIGVLFIISVSSFLILIPLALALAIELFTDYLNAKQNFVDTKESVEYGRKRNYLQSISTDFSFAKEIRLFNLKDRFKARMDEVEELIYRLRNDRFKKSYRFHLLLYFAQFLLNISVYIFFGYQVLVSNEITLGQFTLYTNAVQKFKSSISDVIYVITNAIVNTQYLKGLFDFLNVKPHKSGSANNQSQISCAEIKFENVYFRYPGAECDTLKNINITIKSGETLLIVGENGAGKSTFAKLLCGLYRPTRGRILLNGQDIASIGHEQYYRQISAVFQDYNLFAMSIADNVSSGQEYDEANIYTALGQAYLFEKIIHLEKGIDTQLYRIFDEKGMEFSGGEMQRLAIARAIYKNTPIIVLDEPTSALDPKSEYDIYSSFKEITLNRTAVCISHRLSSIKFSDRIAVFNDGEIIEYGTHDELMRKNGVYADLFNIQSELYLKETK